jgi:hypothetical protein
MVNGSYVRYEGDITATPRVRNHPEARAHPEETARLIIQEVQLGHMIGPFMPSDSPLPFTRISPLNIVPKKESWRLINDLSSPKCYSVNDGIYHMPTKWQLIQHALQLMTDMGRGCHLAKMDVKSAYRLLPIHPTDWHLFGCIIEGLLFIDTYMPFGGRSSGYIWERYAQAMQWILLHKYGIPPTSRWVDDFLFVLDPVNSHSMLLQAKQAFIDLGVPMDASKQEGPCTSLVYIGYTLNSEAMTIGTSAKQCERAMPLLDEACGRSITLADLEKLIGKLEFMSLPVRMGRSYMYHTRRALYIAQHKRESIASSMPTAMYRVHLNADSRAEMRWWQTALTDDITCSIDMHIPWPSTVVPIEPTSDASEWGCGAYCGDEYISVQWSDQVKQITGIASGTHRNMPLCEAIGVAIAVSTWRQRFAGQRVRFHTDCTAVVAGCNKGRASIKASEWLHSVYAFINELCCTHHIDLRAVHIKGTNNTLSDHLSRNQVQQFQTTAAAHSLTASPAPLQPIIIRSSLLVQPITFPETLSRALHPHTEQHGRATQNFASNATYHH